MRNIKAYILTGIAVMSMSVTGLAEVPEELKGSWVLDMPPTVNYMKASSEWDDDAEQKLSAAMKRMSQEMLEFTDESLVASMRGEKTVIPISLTNRESNVYAFKGQLGENPITLTVSVTNGANINIRSSANNDLDFYLWKQGRLAKEDGPSDEVPVPCPEFSWDTIPLYVHIRKSKKFRKHEINYLASFPLITFEKTTGHKTYGTTDAGTIAAAQAVKQINPKVKVLFYRNVLVHYGGYSFDSQLEDIKTPFLICKKGKDNLLRNGRMRAYDLDNPAVTEWWVKSAASVCADPAIDGLFIDGNVKVLLPILQGRLRVGKKDKVVEGYHDMMRRTSEALGPDKLMIANIIRANLPECGLRELNAYFDGSYIEGFDGGAEHMLKGIEAVQKAARSGKIIAMTLGLGKSAAALDNRIDDVRERLTDEDTPKLQERIDYCIALFLICAEKYSYLYLHDGYSAESMKLNKMWMKRLPEYDKSLGPPKGPAIRKGNHFKREFKHATAYLDVEGKIGKIVWHK